MTSLILFVAIMSISIENIQKLIKKYLIFSSAMSSEVDIEKETYTHISELCRVPGGEGLGPVWTVVLTGIH